MSNQPNTNKRPRPLEGLRVVEFTHMVMGPTCGLVLADIQLADGSSGIDAVKDILKSMDVPVIFITAFPERLLTGEQLEPAFLISKPFQPEVLRTAIGQALAVHPPQKMN